MLLVVRCSSGVVRCSLSLCASLFVVGFVSLLFLDSSGFCFVDVSVVWYIVVLVLDACCVS